MGRSLNTKTALSLLISGLSVSTSGYAVGAAAEPCCASGDNGKPSQLMVTRSRMDLGKPVPAVQNLSLVPDWQAFVFTRDSVRYVELAGADGVPRAAFTVVSQGVLALPIGGDLVRQVAVAPPLASTVYQDDHVAVGVLTDAEGATSWQVYVK